jgi:hypothetical protein
MSARDFIIGVCAQRNSEAEQRCDNRAESRFRFEPPADGAAQKAENCRRKDKNGNADHTQISPGGWSRDYSHNLAVYWDG